MELLERSAFFRYFLTINKTRENNGMSMSDILTLREVAEYLKLNEKTTYRLVAERKIPGFKVGGAWRFKKDVLDLWIKEKSESTNTQLSTMRRLP